MSRFTTCSLTILLAFAPAALAVDGTVIINQSTITNGLTGCPTGGHFPVIICQSGSYRLSSNLTVPDANTDAIDITANNVTIDLNGFSILGPVVCGGTPFTCSPSGNGGGGIGIFSIPIFVSSTSSIVSNNVVMNGQIRGMRAATNLASNSRVEKIQATSNGFGILVGGASLVSSCIATSNGNYGIQVSEKGNVVTGNVANGNNGDGIFAGSESVISGNSVIGNTGVGIRCAGGLVSGNVALENSSGNLSAPGCTVTNNVAP